MLANALLLVEAGIPADEGAAMDEHDHREQLLLLLLMAIFHYGRCEDVQVEAIL
jgi:hypothetical protein